MRDYVSNFIDRDSPWTSIFRPSGSASHDMSRHRSRSPTPTVLECTEPEDADFTYIRLVNGFVYLAIILKQLPPVSDAEFSVCVYGHRGCSHP